MRKPFISLRLIFLIMCSRLCYSVPIQKSFKAQLNPYYLKAVAAYKRLERKLPRDELRAITAIGILNGAKQAEKQMEKNLIETVKDLIHNTNVTDNNLIIPKIENIENQLERDQKSLEILTKTLDLATNSTDSQTFKLEMLDILKSPKASIQRNDTNKTSEANDIGKRVAKLRKQILKQVDLMKNVLDDKIDYTLEYLIDHANAQGPLAKASSKILRKRQTEVEEPARIMQIKSILTEDDFRNNLVDVAQADNKHDSLFDDNLSLADNIELMISNATNAINATNASNTTNATSIIPAKQEEGSPEFFDDNDDLPPAGGGGLVGIITSLSGGEGGSDIGALIGALTGVIAQIFGPNGLDIETLLSSATALISGLLAGDRNFGTVLGIYVGTAFDGLSGGGGAINNGQFIGNFLGTVVASLSADPEEDNVPPKPLIFIKNLVTSFIEAKNRPLSDDEDSAERKEDGNQSNHKGGSDSAAFIKHVVSHVVGGIVSIILNAALGASGGSSQASQSIFAGSSSDHKPASDPNRGQW